MKIYGSKGSKSEVTTHGCIETYIIIIIIIVIIIIIIR